MSRFFTITVTDNGVAYEAPADAIYTVRFGGAPGMPSGWYDTITEVGGSSRPAVVVSDNVYTVEIAEQALSKPGKNALVIIISDATGYTLASWAFELDVNATPGLEAPAVTTYYNLLAQQVAQVIASTGEAASSAAAAAQSAAEAQQSATQAASSAAAAAQSAAEAQQSATQAASSASAAAQSASSADSNASAAAQSAQSATASASSASQSKTAAATSASQAQQSATQAGDSAVLAESWAVGGTGTRQGEDTNNAQHWAEEAQRVSQGALGWYETEQALQSAHPTGQNGEWAIIGSTDTIWTWDSDTGAWVDSGAQVDLSSYYTKAQADAAFATAAQGQKADSAVQTVNGSDGPAASVTTQNLFYQIGDTITTSDVKFDPNATIGGTWTKKIAGLGFLYAQNLMLDSSVSTPNAQFCQYVVSNGMCTVTLDQITTPGSAVTTIATGLPPASLRVFYTASNGAQALINPGTTILQSIANPGFASESFSIAYPVADASPNYGARFYIWTKTA